MNRILLGSKLIVDNCDTFYFDVKNDSNIVINPSISCNINLISDNGRGNLVIDVCENSDLIINLFGIDSSFNIDINLFSNSKIKLCYSMVANRDADINVKVNHKGINSKSEIVNHIANRKDGFAKIVVDLIVPKGVVGCNTLQDNKIINLENGEGMIQPNLLIEEFDTFAEHSAYISKFNKDELFYLMSRGISLELANELLEKAFLIGRMDSNEEFIDLIKNKI